MPNWYLTDLATSWPIPHHPDYSSITPVNKNMKLFASLRKLREFERVQLTFIRSLIDLDIIIIIEIGYAQENKQPLTPKPLFLMGLGSVATVRRRLAKLTELGIVHRRANPNDQRSDVLTVSRSGLKLMGQYGAQLSGFSASN